MCCCGAGVQLETAQAIAALSCFTALTRLDLSRCKVGAPGLAAIATSLVSLQDLSLAESNGMTSFTELQPLQQLSSLMKLDLSSPGGPSMRQPGRDLTAVCQLTQLRHLALNNVMSRSWCVPTLQQRCPVLALHLCNHTDRICVCSQQ